MAVVAFVVSAASVAVAEDPAARELMERVVGTYRSVAHERENLSLVVVQGPGDTVYDLAQAKQIAAAPPRGAPWPMSPASKGSNPFTML